MVETLGRTEGMLLGTGGVIMLLCALFYCFGHRPIVGRQKNLTALDSVMFTIVPVHTRILCLSYGTTAWLQAVYILGHGAPAFRGDTIFFCFFQCSVRTRGLFENCEVLVPTVEGLMPTCKLKLTKLNYLLPLWCMLRFTTCITRTWRRSTPQSWGEHRTAQGMP